LTYELNLDNIRVSHHAKYLVQKLLSGHTQTQTHPTDCSTWATEVIGNYLKTTKYVQMVTRKW